MANFIYNQYGNSVKYLADVAGGQGLLTRILNKKYGYKSEVIDPRGYVLKGVPNTQKEYTIDMATFYDLIIGLHPDEATRPIVESAIYRPILIVPCCNFWDTNRKLGSKELIKDICMYLDVKKIKYQKGIFDFKGPKNVCIYTPMR